MPGRAVIRRPVTVSVPAPRTWSPMTRPQTSIRLVTHDDAPALAALLCRDAKAFAPWDPARPPEYYTADGQLRLIERQLIQHADGERWPGVIVADSEVIGRVSVQDILRAAWRRASLGYWVATTHQGEGHASRAVDLVTRLMVGDLGLRRAEAATQLNNIPSQRVLRRNGFTPFGIAREYIFVGGEWRDEILWERILDR